MSDAPVPPAPESPASKDPMTSGKHTTEWTLTLIAQVLGGVLEMAATAIQTLQAGGVNATWFAGVLAIIGVVLQVATAFGYVRGRAIVKSAALAAGALAAQDVVTAKQAGDVFRSSP